jgi:hypothetical protein
MKLRLALCFSAMSVLLGFAPSVWAHSTITLPKPREVNASGGIKAGPCGYDAKPATAVPAANTFKPGATIMMAWTEVIGHPGWYRVAFDQDGQDGFVDPTQADYTSSLPIRTIRD